MVFRELKRTVSSENLLNYPIWNILFTVYTDAYYIQLGAVISKNNKPIAFLFLRKLVDPHSDYTTTEK